MTTSVATSLVGDLILVRLLASGKRPPGPSRLRKDLARFFRHAPDAEQWQGYLDELVRGGLLTAGPYRLTDAGRAKALEFLGLDALPSGTNWKIVRTRYLLLKALGVQEANAEMRKRIAGAEGLGAFLIKAHYDLPAGAGTTLTRALEALVCRELGFPAETSLDAVKATVLSRLLGATERLGMGQVREQFPRQVAGTSKGGVEGLREAVLQRWVEGANGQRPEAAAVQEQPAEAGEFDLPAFAATVQAAARHCPSGWFGDNKVFINHVWSQLGQEPGLPALDLPAFKARLVEANHAGLLRLERADLVQAMDPADVRESETPYLNAVFHFVLVERDRP
jgi:hypothetical protein